MRVPLPHFALLTRSRTLPISSTPRALNYPQTVSFHFQQNRLHRKICNCSRVEQEPNYHQKQSTCKTSVGTEKGRWINCVCVGAGVEGVGCGGSCSHRHDSVTRVCVGVEGNADFLPSPISLGPYNQARPAFIKKGRLQLRPFKKPYKAATTLHQRGFGTGSGGGVRKG